MKKRERYRKKEGIYEEKKKKKEREVRNLSAMKEGVEKTWRGLEILNKEHKIIMKEKIIRRPKIMK